MKSYARNHGEPNENDKGYVSISYSKYAMKLYYKQSDTYAHVYRLSLLCAFIFLNILTPVALAKSVSLYYPKIVAKSSKGDFMGCLYWAAAVITFSCNTLYTALSIRDYFFHGKTAITSCLIHHNCSDTYIYNDEVTTFVAMLIVIPSAVFIELSLSIYAVKRHFNGQMKHCLFQAVHVFAFVEYSDNTTTVHQGCYSSLCATADPSTSDCSLHCISFNGTCLHHIHCCLPTVSLSTTKTKDLLQENKL